MAATINDFPSFMESATILRVSEATIRQGQRTRGVFSPEHRLAGPWILLTCERPKGDLSNIWGPGDFKYHVSKASRAPSSWEL